MSKISSKNLSFCCVQNKKCIKIPILWKHWVCLFSLLRFFDELFDLCYCLEKYYLLILIESFTETSRDMMAWRQSWMKITNNTTMSSTQLGLINALKENQLLYFNESVKNIWSLPLILIANRINFFINHPKKLVNGGLEFGKQTKWVSNSLVALSKNFFSFHLIKLNYGSTVEFFGERFFL